MSQLIELTSGSAALNLAPEMGGGIASLSSNDTPILRAWSGKLSDGPFALASNILLPFSNRVSRQFQWKGKAYTLPPNIDGENLPLHGDAFNKKWTIGKTTPNSIELDLTNGEFGPFRYCAQQKFILNETNLLINLTLTNLAEEELPYGFGFHPWFPRNADTQIAFSADAVGLQNADFLPEEYVNLSNSPDWDYDTARPLPSELINNDFTGWNGKAKIDQGQNAKSLEVTASENLPVAIIYSPNENADFFCFEPVSHPINSLNQQKKAGFTPLAPKQSLSAWLKLDWS